MSFSPSVLEIMEQFDFSCRPKLQVAQEQSMLLVTPEFKAWATCSSYKLEKLPFARRRAIGKDCVHYRILHPHPDSTGQQAYTVTKKTVPLPTFLQTLQKGNFDGVAVSDILCLYLQMPNTQHIPNEWVVRSTPIFSQLRSFIYSGNPRQLELALGVSWVVSFPEIEQVKIIGRTASSTFRNVINGCRKLTMFSMNLLFEEDNGGQGSRQPEKVVNPGLEQLRVVSNMGVERAFKGMELTGLKNLHLWMMPGVAMELCPEHLEIRVREPAFHPNFKVDESAYSRGVVLGSRFRVVNPE